MSISSSKQVKYFQVSSSYEYNLNGICILFPIPVPIKLKRLEKKRSIFFEQKLTRFKKYTKHNCKAYTYPTKHTT